MLYETPSYATPHRPFNHPKLPRTDNVQSGSDKKIASYVKNMGKEQLSLSLTYLDGLGEGGHGHRTRCRHRQVQVPCSRRRHPGEEGTMIRLSSLVRLRTRRRWGPPPTWRQNLGLVPLVMGHFRSSLRFPSLYNLEGSPSFSFASRPSKVWSGPSSVLSPSSRNCRRRSVPVVLQEPNRRHACKEWKRERDAE